MILRISSAKNQAVQIIRYLFIMKGAEVCQPGPCTFQGIQIIPVVKTERLIQRHTQGEFPVCTFFTCMRDGRGPVFPTPWHGGMCTAGIFLPWLGRMCHAGICLARLGTMSRHAGTRLPHFFLTAANHGQHIQVHGIFHAVGQPFHLFLKPVNLIRQDQPQVPASHLQKPKLRHITDDRDVKLFLHQRLYPSIYHGGYAVKQHTSDSADTLYFLSPFIPGYVFQEPLNLGCQRQAGPLGVYHQDDGQFKNLGYFP